MDAITSFIAFIVTFLILFIILALVMFVIWILTLIHQAKRKLWVWFVLTLIFGLFFGVGTILIPIYWIVWIFRGRAWNRRKR